MRFTFAPQDGANNQPQGDTFNSSRSQLPFLILFCTPFIVVGLYLATDNLLDARAAAETASWSKVPATIQDCQVRVHTDSDGPDTYDVAVHYTYEYGGRTRASRTFTKRRLTFGNKARTAALCARLLASGTLSAYVNPEKPAHAVIIPGSSVADYLGVAFGLTFATFSATFLWMCVLFCTPTSAESLLDTGEGPIPSSH